MQTLTIRLDRGHTTYTPDAVVLSRPDEMVRDRYRIYRQSRTVRLQVRAPLPGELPAFRGGTMEWEAVEGRDSHGQTLTWWVGPACGSPTPLAGFVRRSDLEAAGLLRAADYDDGRYVRQIGHLQAEAVVSEPCPEWIPVWVGDDPEGRTETYRRIAEGCEARGNTGNGGRGWAALCDAPQFRRPSHA